MWGENKHRASLVWRDPQVCKALKLRQRSSALTFHPQYETFFRECGLYAVISLLGQTPCKELVTTLLERWRPETNTFHLLQGEATITLEDVEVLTGLPTRGRPVSACKALKLRQRSSALTFHPQYETFLRESGLYAVVSLLGQTSCKELVTTLLERWRPETNTFHLLQGEATITLEDVEVLTGLPTRGRPVSVGYDSRAADVIC
ncbi:Protein MAIN-LIKE 2 [Linum perenne]